MTQQLFFSSDPPIISPGDVAVNRRLGGSPDASIGEPGLVGLESVKLGLWPLVSLVGSIVEEGDWGDMSEESPESPFNVVCDDCRFFILFCN